MATKTRLPYSISHGTLTLAALSRVNPLFLQPHLHPRSCIWEFGDRVCHVITPLQRGGRQQEKEGGESDRAHESEAVAGVQQRKWYRHQIAIVCTVLRLQSECGLLRDALLVLLPKNGAVGLVCAAEDAVMLQHLVCGLSAMRRRVPRVGSRGLLAAWCFSDELSPRACRSALWLLHCLFHSGALPEATGHGGAVAFMDGLLVSWRRLVVMAGRSGKGAPATGDVNNSTRALAAVQLIKALAVYNKDENNNNNGDSRDEASGDGGGGFLESDERALAGLVHMAGSGGCCRDTDHGFMHGGVAQMRNLIASCEGCLLPKERDRLERRFEQLLSLHTDDVRTAAAATTVVLSPRGCGGGDNADDGGRRAASPRYSQQQQQQHRHPMLCTLVLPLLHRRLVQRSLPSPSVTPLSSLPGTVDAFPELTLPRPRRHDNTDGSSYDTTNTDTAFGTSDDDDDGQNMIMMSMGGGEHSGHSFSYSVRSREGTPVTVAAPGDGYVRGGGVFEVLLLLLTFLQRRGQHLKQSRVLLRQLLPVVFRSYRSSATGPLGMPAFCLGLMNDSGGFGGGGDGKSSVSTYTNSVCHRVVDAVFEKRRGRAAVRSVDMDGSRVVYAECTTTTGSSAKVATLIPSVSHAPYAPHTGIACIEVGTHSVLGASQQRLDAVNMVDPDFRADPAPLFHEPPSPNRCCCDHEDAVLLPPPPPPIVVQPPLVAGARLAEESAVPTVLVRWLLAFELHTYFPETQSRDSSVDLLAPLNPCFAAATSRGLFSSQQRHARQRQQQQQQQQRRPLLDTTLGTADCAFPVLFDAKVASWVAKEAPNDPDAQLRMLRESLEDLVRQANGGSGSGNTPEQQQQHPSSAAVSTMKKRRRRKSEADQRGGGGGGHGAGDSRSSNGHSNGRRRCVI